MIDYLENTLEEARKTLSVKSALAGLYREVLKKVVSSLPRAAKADGVQYGKGVRYGWDAVHIRGYSRGDIPLKADIFLSYEALDTEIAVEIDRPDIGRRTERFLVRHTESFDGFVKAIVKAIAD